MFDTARTFETPEGIDLSFRVAGPVARSLAWSIDALYRTGLYIVCGIVFSFFGRFGMGVLLVIIFLLEWAYPVFFEVLRDGATPGKKSLGLRVINDNGTPVSWGTSVTRNLLRAADFAPMFYGFGLCAMLMNKDFKRLGDMAAGTIVIYASSTIPQTDLPEAQSCAIPKVLSIKEQRAILDYSERSKLLSSQRQVELANVITCLTGEDDEKGVEKIHQYANWLHGTHTSELT